MLSYLTNAYSVLKTAITDTQLRPLCQTLFFELESPEADVVDLTHTARNLRSPILQSCQLNGRSTMKAAG